MISYRRVIISAVCILSLALLRCSDSQEDPVLPPPIDLSQPWELSNSTSENIAPLNTVLSEAINLKRLTSVTIFRNGKLVSESYFKGYKADSLHDVRSVTKTVVSLLVGIAIEKGFLKSVDEPIGNYLPSTEYNLTTAQKNITILHLLTMSSGFQWNEVDGNAYNEWILSADPFNFLLTKPLTDSPGSAFNYNSAAVHLLSIVLIKATKMPLPDFANQYLFSKIGIGRVAWEKWDGTNVNGSSGIRLTPPDMGRIGQLLMQKGWSASETIVPESWIEAMIKPAYSWRSNYGALKNYTYGRLVWIDEGTASYFAWGFGGQFIYVKPAQQLIVVTTTDWRKSSEAGGVTVIEQEAFDIIINKILPKVK